MTDPIRLDTDVLVIGAGAAGMAAARAASDAGARVVIADKSIIGRGGASVMAQMTVAAALGDAEPDSPELHAEDTMAGARGLADARLVDLITRRAPEEIHRLASYGAPWAKTADGRLSQITAPGHTRRRCVYVDMLKTGEGVTAALRRVTRRDPQITKLQNVMFTRLLRDDGELNGAVGVSLADMATVGVTASAVIIATGGLTKAFMRTSASANMTGDGLLLAADVGARLADLELVQFFPIAHLWPRLVHLDPIMWDPFRYKLGGRLLNGVGNEFMDSYAGEAGGTYTATRDETTRAILAEVEAGRGSPHGGAFLDFRSSSVEDLEAAFGPVLTILSDQGVELTRDMVEVAPMAHFLLGGIHVSPEMQSSIPGLFACGESIWGMHGANRLSGNAVTEALVTGRIAGDSAARNRRPMKDPSIDSAMRDEQRRFDAFSHPRTVERDDAPVGQWTSRLRSIASEHVGPLRSALSLSSAVDDIQSVQRDAADIALARERVFPMSVQEKYELRTMAILLEAVARGAMAREETRGAHVRLDHPEQQSTAHTTFFERSDEQWSISQRPAATYAVTGQ